MSYIEKIVREKEIIRKIGEKEQLIADSHDEVSDLHEELRHIKQEIRDYSNEAKQLSISLVIVEQELKEELEFNKEKNFDIRRLETAIEQLSSL